MHLNLVILRIKSSTYIEILPDLFSIINKDILSNT